MEVAGSAAKRVALEAAGWVLLCAGLAAIFLPGPGLLMIFAGLALLSRQYEWANRRVQPVRLRAMRGAAESVATWPRILVSLLAAVVLAVCGVLWIAQPPAPGWWPFADSWWLPGGLWTGITQIASAVIAVALIVYSYRRFHGRPGALRALEEEIEQADKGAGRRRETAER